MQKLWSLLVLSLMPLFVSAQYVPVYPMVEHFTNTRCILCPPLNGILYPTLESYSGFVHQVSYHPPVPYPQDSFYLANPLPQNTRRLHYAVSGTPQAFFNGMSVRQGQQLVPVSVIEAARGTKTGLEVQLDELIIQGDMQVSVSVRTINEDSLPSMANYKLFVILIEDSVSYPAPNGENLHHNIFREVLTSMDGDSFLPPAEDVAIPFNFTYQVQANWNLEHLHALAFVFDENGVFVNSASQLNLRLSTSSTISNNQNDATATVIAQRGVPPYTYLWNDPDSQTTATAIGLNGGEYLVTVTDSSGISIQEKVFVETQVSNEKTISFHGKVLIHDNQLELRDFPKEKLGVKVYGLDGKLLLSRTVTGQQSIEFIKPAPGLYIVEVQGQSGNWTEKIWIRE